jgi:hypothetical protein
MAARRGKRLTYSGSVFFDPNNPGPNNLTVDFRDYSDDDFIKAWERSCKHDPFEGLYDKLKRAAQPAVSLNCSDVKQALEFLHAATGDANFLRAAAAMKLYGLTRGGLKKSALNKISSQKHALWAAMPKMRVWIENEKVSPNMAAKLVAVQRQAQGLRVRYEPVRVGTIPLGQGRESCRYRGR